MAKPVGKTLVKKKKNWVGVYGSNAYENVFLGESLGEKAGDLMGRVIETNLSDISRDVKRQNVKLSFKVNSIKENRAIADVTGYEIMASYLRRSVMKMKNKMNDSFECNTKDGVKLQIKPLLMTKSSSQKAKLSVIRKKTRDLITHEVSNMSYNEVIDAIVGYKLQKMLRDTIKKISPLAVCEIRVVERLS